MKKSLRSLKIIAGINGGKHSSNILTKYFINLKQLFNKRSFVSIITIFSFLIYSCDTFYGITRSLEIPSEPNRAEISNLLSEIDNIQIINITDNTPKGVIYSSHPIEYAYQYTWRESTNNINGNIKITKYTDGTVSLVQYSYGAGKPPVGYNEKVLIIRSIMMRIEKKT